LLDILSSCDLHHLCRNSNVSLVGVEAEQIAVAVHLAAVLGEDRMDRAEAAVVEDRIYWDLAELVASAWMASAAGEAAYPSVVAEGSCPSAVVAASAYALVVDPEVVSSVDLAYRP